jgi:hypothetical protein
MTWEEHEREYGLVLSDIPDNIRCYDSIPNSQWYSDVDGSSYGSAHSRCDGLTWEFNDMLSFHPVRVGEVWHCISNDDLYDNGYDAKGNRLYQSWVIDRIISEGEAYLNTRIY